MLCFEGQLSGLLQTFLNDLSLKVVHLCSFNRKKGENVMGKKLTLCCKIEQNVSCMLGVIFAFFHRYSNLHYIQLGFSFVFNFF